ncbi:MAG: Kdo hydroxylase family protein [Alphaproteobacteria bacterium]|nr:Kdo hydroxylase family protein [Alphaproteobacteria bacterium]
MLETLPIASWTGPYAPEVKARAVEALENGGVLFFPNLPFQLSEKEKSFLDAGVSDGKAKNISRDPDGTLQSTSLTGKRAQALGAMMGRFADSTSSLIGDLLPYREIERARTSYRPVQVKGRSQSKISDDRLLHIDAFPSRPMRGRRILRFFANVAPSSPRHWHVGQPFEDFAKSFLPRIGPDLPGKSWLYEKLGVTRGRRSRYDELMLSLHDTAKLDDNFQKNSPHQKVDFPPGCCWLVFTDMVLHAALGGEFALEQTFHLDIDQMAEPARAPIKVLERLSGKALA